MKLANKPSKKKSLRLYICDFINYLILNSVLNTNKIISTTSHWSFRLAILHQFGAVLNSGIKRKYFVQ